jgi:OOP family OmpA-OmpF porin
MPNKWNMFVVRPLVMCFLALGTAFAAPQGGDVQVRGMIISRSGDTLIVRTSNGNTSVLLDDGTKTRDNVGFLGLGKKDLSNIVLIPGLKVKVDGQSDNQGGVVARTITVDGDDLEAAEMIQSGLHPTAEQVASNVAQLSTHQREITTSKQNIAANKEDITTNTQDIAGHALKIEQSMKDIQEHTERFIALADYDVKDQAIVKFPVNSSKISPKDVDQLKQLGQRAASLTGYLIEVTGYADATGSAEMNTKLSEDRAKAVVTVLMQQGGVPVRRIMAPGAMGEYGAAVTNETKEGRAQNRRVEVKVIVNKGIAGL